MYSIYVIWSQKLRKRYVGSTQNVTSRLEQHNKGKTPFTSRGIPWILIHQEEFAARSQALKREKFLKTGAGRKWLDNMFPQYQRSDK